MAGKNTAVFGIYDSYAAVERAVFRRLLLGETGQRNPRAHGRDRYRLGG
jgi:hypothetical protein